MVYVDRRSQRNCLDYLIIHGYPLRINHGWRTGEIVGLSFPNEKQNQHQFGSVGAGYICLTNRGEGTHPLRRDKPGETPGRFFYGL